jgi:hypothetical protein
LLDLGVVKPGSTIRIPFASFDKDDGSSITMTNFSTSDVLVYKDGNTTARASTSGFTATTDFNSKTGRHVLIIDLADNTTADFFAAGSEYLVMIDSVTVDTITVGDWAARFRIGYDGAILDTTIATLSSQTSFTLTGGPAEDDALNGHWAIIHDAASAVQFARVLILDYTGSTKTVTLAAGATFTVAAKDNFSLMGMAPMQPATLGRNPVVDASGLVDANAVKLGPTGSGTAQTARDIGASVLLSSGTGPGQLDFTSGRVKADTVYFGGSAGSFTTGVPAVNTTLIAGSLVSTSTAQIGVNVVNFGGSAGTFSSGRPEVNATHWGGTAVASANVRANLIQIGGDTQSGTDLKDFVDTGYDPAAHGVTVTTNSDKTGYTLSSAGQQALVETCFTFNATADYSTADAGSLVKQIADNAGGAGTGSGLTAIPWNAAWDAEVQSEVQDAIEANHLDHLIAVADPGGVVANSSFLAKLVSKSATPAFTSFVNTTDSLEAIRDRGDAAWTTGSGGAGGSGSIEWDVTVNTSGGSPISGVQVWVTTDAAGDDVVAGTLTTDNFGVVTFMLDAGTYYVWQQLGGYNFTNPQEITVA